MIKRGCVAKPFPLWCLSADVRIEFDDRMMNTKVIGIGTATSPPTQYPYIKDQTHKNQNCDWFTNLYNDFTELTVGTAAGITVFFCAILILILAFHICRHANKRGGTRCLLCHVHCNHLHVLPSTAVVNVPDTGNDVIYEQCGGKL